MNSEQPDLVVVDEAEQHVAVVKQLQLQVVSTGMQGPTGPPGPQGPKGEPGLSGASFVHIQDAPAAVWTIAHGLSRYPHTTCVDSAGSAVWGDAEYQSDDVVVLRFSAPFAGRAYLN